jgi:hypothetical protein
VIPAWLPLFALLGAILGVGYFTAVRTSSAAVASGRFRTFIAFWIGRTIVLVAALVAVVHAGPLPLLATFGGILVARQIVVRRVAKDTR